VEKKAMNAIAEGVTGLDDSSSSEQTPKSVAKALRPIGRNTQKLIKERTLGMLISRMLWRLLCK
jgi:hypothetical protein